MNFDLLAISDLWFASQQIPTKVFQKVDSTANCAKSDAATATSPIAVYMAGQQTAGRGRGSNSWSANPGEAFLVSISFAVEQSVQPIAAPLVGLALIEALCAVWPGLPFSLKAPNDIYLGDKKVIGILLEAVEGSTKRLILSYGFNVSGSPAEVSTATSLFAAHSGLSSAEWKKFLSQSFVKLKYALAAGTQTTMTQATCDNLCKALNSNPNLVDKFTAVDPDGSLRSATGLTRWQDL